MEELKTITRQELIGTKDYDAAWEVDLFIEDELVFGYKDFIVEAHVSDGYVDYTVYNKNDLSEIDGGQMDFDDDTNCVQIIELMTFTDIEGLKEQKFDDVNWENVIFYDYEEFQERIC